MKTAREVCPGFSFTDANRRQIAEIFRWCVMLPCSLDPDRGLFLWGNVGTGKSTVLRIVREFCAKIGRNRSNGCPTFRLTLTPDVCAAYSEDGYDGIKTYIESPAQGFDDLGTETIPTGHYGTNCNVMQHVLHCRYDRRRDSLTHATANLSPDGLEAVYGERVFDRCTEMFNFIEMPGRSMRPGIAKPKRQTKE